MIHPLVAPLVICDTGPMIAFEKIPGGFQLLRPMVGQLLIPPQVLDEPTAGLCGGDSGAPGRCDPIEVHHWSPYPNSPTSYPETGGFDPPFPPVQDLALKPHRPPADPPRGLRGAKKTGRLRGGRKGRLPSCTIPQDVKRLRFKT
jgi:hypothetical protein